jgi:hypothetical protein
MRTGGWFGDSFRHSIAAKKRCSNTEYMKMKYNRDVEIKRGAREEAEEHAKTIRRIEIEHPKVGEGAEWIAEDHVDEFPGVSYYDELELMERRLGKRARMRERLK